jgi:protein-S-isoprenylcysteine O-methyltransferase Ste14
LLIAAVGLIGAVLGMANLGFRRAFGQEVDEPQQSGLYGVTRNPQILMYGPAVIGYALLWPSWYALGWVGLYAAIAHIMVLTEEEHLRRVGGETYVRYCERVPRYIPLLAGRRETSE